MIINCYMSGVMLFDRTQMPRWQSKSRREYLLAVGIAGLTSIAGCSGSDSSDEGSPSNERSPDGGDGRSETEDSTTNDVDERSETENPEDGSDSEETENPEPSFEVVSLSIRDEIELGDSASLELKVRNSGNGSGNFTREVQITSKALDYSQYNHTGYDIGGVVDPGETETFTREITGNNIGSFRLSIEQHDVEAETSVVARDLSLGEDYTNVKGVKMSVDEIVVQDSYEGEDGGTVRPDTGKFVIVRYSGENTGNETVNPSSAFDLRVRTREGNYRHSLKGDNAANYDKIQFTRELEPGETLEGYQFFEVDFGAERRDLTVTWKGIIGNTERRVNWRP